MPWLHFSLRRGLCVLSRAMASFESFTAPPSTPSGSAGIKAKLGELFRTIEEINEEISIKEDNIKRLRDNIVS